MTKQSTDQATAKASEKLIVLYGLAPQVCPEGTSLRKEATDTFLTAFGEDPQPGAHRAAWAVYKHHREHDCVVCMAALVADLRHQEAMFGRGQVAPMIWQKPGAIEELEQRLEQKRARLHQQP